MNSRNSNNESAALFRRYEIAWRIYGRRFNGYRYLYGIHDLVFIVIFTICYPSHIILGLLQSRTQKEIFSNLCYNMACFACSLKFFALRRNLRLMEEISILLSQLEKRVQKSVLADKEYFKNTVISTASRFINAYIFMYSAIVLTSLLSFLLIRERRLSYPAWFPFDWQASEVNYYCAISYQYIGLIFLAVQNFACDVYSPLCLSMFTGHVYLLRQRIQRIGYDSTKHSEQHEQDLIECVEEYNMLIRLYKVIQETISMPLLMQFILGALNLAVCVIYTIFYADDVFGYAYYILQLVALPLQLFPSCYYGSKMELEFQELTYSLFLCNWLDQGRSFRQNTVVMTQLTLRKTTLIAGGMIRIHVDSFISTCKITYSFFALIITMK